MHTYLNYFKKLYVAAVSIWKLKIFELNFHIVYKMSPNGYLQSIKILLNSSIKPLKWILRTLMHHKQFSISLNSLIQQ